MSHVINHSTYRENVDKNKVQAEWDNCAAMDDWQEGCTGLGSPIRWLNAEPRESYEEAEQFIKEKDKGCYDQLAVRYKEYKIKKTSAILNLEKRLKETRGKLEELEAKVHYKDAKSAYITCKGCGSRLNREIVTNRLRTNRCPICGEDLRPESTLKRIENLRTKRNEIQKRLKEEEKKVAKKSKYEVRWLVKTEYHV